MIFKPKLSVKESLDHLAQPLDPIIAARFADQLGGHPWTVVLEILDQKKGFKSGYKHWPHDLQAQLRMLTERLGDFGYPFDDQQRTVSTIGNELRIVRKRDVARVQNALAVADDAALTLSASGETWKELDFPTCASFSA